MSEEEIIYILKKRIERKTVSSDPYYITQQAIQGILNLYKQEKEKSKKCEYYEEIADELYKANKEHQKLNGELRTKITKLEEKNDMLSAMFKKYIKE